MEMVINLEGCAAAARTFGQQAPFDRAIIDDVSAEAFAVFSTFDGAGVAQLGYAIKLTSSLDATAASSVNKWSLPLTTL